MKLIAESIVSSSEVLCEWLILRLWVNFVQKIQKFPSLSFTYNIVIMFLLDLVFVFDLILVKDVFKEIVESSNHWISLKKLSIHSLVYPHILIEYNWRLSLKVFQNHFLNFIINLFFNPTRFGFSK